MAGPFDWRKLIHPETDGEGRIRHPFTVGLRNTITAYVPLSLAAATYLYKYRALLDSVAWWLFIGTALVVAVIAFGHAYLGASIGGKRANTITIVLLLAILVSGIWALTLYLEHLR
jgi:hypothetical protein